MKFAEPYLAFLFILIPALILFITWAELNKRRIMSLSFHRDLIQELDKSYLPFNRLLKLSLLVVITALFVFTLMRPQWGKREVVIEQKGIDLVIVFDLSRSMLAEDIKPSRLERAKIELPHFLDGVDGNRVALVAFAGSAYVACPLTLDTGALKDFIDTLDPSLIARQGTSIGNALRVARKAFLEDNPEHRAILVISDGEDHTEDSENEAKACAKDGIKIFTAGIGTPNGDTIPIHNENGEADFVKDVSGRVVVSRVDRAGLERIAVAGGGSSVFSSGNSFSLSSILEALGKLDRKKLGSQKLQQFEDRYQYFLAGLLALLLLEFLLFEIRGQKELKTPEEEKQDEEPT
jgi:Ca-activated chloride channel family protein